MGINQGGDTRQQQTSKHPACQKELRHRRDAIKVFYGFTRARWLDYWLLVPSGGRDESPANNLVLLLPDPEHPFGSIVSNHW